MQPQYIKIDKNARKFYYSDKEMTILHREDGPAFEWSEDCKEWWLNGLRHREDGPAFEWSDGTKAWWLNGKLHREDGPAYERSSGTKEWYLNGELHREDGPAIEGRNGTRSWWLNGKQISQEEHARLTQKELVLTLDEIAEKFSVPVEKIHVKK